MPKVPERPLSLGERLEIERRKTGSRQTHGKPLDIRKLTAKRRKAESEQRK